MMQAEDRKLHSQLKWFNVEQIKEPSSEEVIHGEYTK